MIRQFIEVANMAKSLHVCRYAYKIYVRGYIGKHEIKF
jgi:hypothetical protein